MNEPKPTAVGYVCGPPGRELEQQHTAIATYTEVEGLALADVLHDESDACTISQLADAARLHDATRVILPAGVRLAEARQGIDRDLAEQRAVCVVVGLPDADRAAYPTLTFPVLARPPRHTEVIP
ncbi:hypothetical protein ACFT2C_05995 [Promicromonospora sp. NPDC057138]|uniref:hypothetical protein n=1 Tax=Promicromonospora sp. NPDC057138 TaxID=3346031 RepID=UPI00362B4056